MKLKVCSLLFLILSISSCTFNDVNKTTYVVENHFFLVNDFNHRYPEQGDYMKFLKKGYIDSYYYPREEKYTCYYYLEYQNGDIVSDKGTYTCDGTNFNLSLETTGNRHLVFSLYHSPTIDFFIIDTLTYEDCDYKIVYQARYLYSAKG